MTRWHEEGTDPDYRFSLANERTFLAWIRTALAILAGAILLRQFAKDVHPQVLLVAVAATLAALSGVIGAGAYVQWRRNEHAMRLGRALPPNPLRLVLAAALTAAATIAVILLAWP